MTSESTTECPLLNNGIYRLDSETFVALYNDDLPNGDFMFALYYAAKTPNGYVRDSDEPILFVELNGATLFSPYTRTFDEGKTVEDLEPVYDVARVIEAR